MHRAKLLSCEVSKHSLEWRELQLSVKCRSSDGGSKCSSDLKGNEGVLSRNAYESSLTVKCHKDEMQRAHWSDLSKWKQSPFVLLSHTMHQSYADSLSSALMCTLSILSFPLLLCFILSVILMCPQDSLKLTCLVSRCWDVDYWEKNCIFAGILLIPLPCYF